MTQRIGILTSGGDCQSLNATMRGFAKALYEYDPQTRFIGFREGYRGLMYNNSINLQVQDFSGLLTLGGTVLGTSRTPFKHLDEPDPDGHNKVELMKTTYKNQSLDCLIVLGGNGSQKTANRLSQEGLNVIGLPKTIDNDIYGTDVTFGFHSAIKVATNAIDAIHTTAASHGRVFIVEIMGNKTGWLALAAGIAGGVDVVLIPEIPYDIKAVCQKILKRRQELHRFSIIAVAEGAKSRADEEKSKKERKKEKQGKCFPSIAYQVAHEIKKEIGAEVRVTVPGHMQRGGTPSPYDRIIASRIGARGAQAVMEKDYGKLVSVQGEELKTVPLEEIAGVSKPVPTDSPIIQSARQLGIYFGDEIER